MFFLVLPAVELYPDLEPMSTESNSSLAFEIVRRLDQYLRRPLGSHPETKLYLVVKQIQSLYPQIVFSGYPDLHSTYSLFSSHGSFAGAFQLRVVSRFGPLRIHFSKVAVQ